MKPLTNKMEIRRSNYFAHFSAQTSILNFFLSFFYFFRKANKCFWQDCKGFPQIGEYMPKIYAKINIISFSDLFLNVPVILLLTGHIECFSNFLLNFFTNMSNRGCNSFFVDYKSNDFFIKLLN